MIDILVADDHTIVREGVKQILGDCDDLMVAGEAQDGHELIERIRERNWDLLLMDMSMPGRSGIELIRQVKSERPRLPILVLSMHNEEQYGVRAIKAGAAGYLTKDSASVQLVSAIRKIAAGGVFVSPGIAERLALDFLPSTTDTPHKSLSDREYEVFCLIAGGKTLSVIARELCLSIKTVSTHKTRILQKMNMSTTADLIRYAMKHRLVDEP